MPAPPGPGPAFDEADFTVVDVETTGLSTDRGDRVCEIGMVRIRGGAVIARTPKVEAHLDLAGAASRLDFTRP